MAPAAVRAPLDARRAAAGSFTSSQTLFSFEIRTLPKFEPGRFRPAATRRQSLKDVSGGFPDGSVACGSKFDQKSYDDTRCPKRHTACPTSTMVLSAPAEPVFLVGVALGVLIAGAIFALNMRRWRAQQRLR